MFRTIVLHQTMRSVIVLTVGAGKSRTLTDGSDDDAEDRLALRNTVKKRGIINQPFVTPCMEEGEGVTGRFWASLGIVRIVFQG